jgi:NAD+ synthase (glutamine-hydrolysing)
MRPLRLALAQLNTTVGDLAGNADRMIALMDEARVHDVDLIAFPELAVTGYPPEDLLLKRQFLAEADAQLERIAQTSNGMVVVVGAPQLVDGTVFNAAVAETPDGITGALYNVAAVAVDGNIVYRYRKIFLPNYGVFDEQRYFTAGDECPVFSLRGVQVGVNVCEDIWFREGPTSVQRAAGAEVIVNINASPYHRDKGAYRQQMLSARAAEQGVFVVYVNAVGGQDELVFDGQSFVMGPTGEVVSRGPQFEEALLVVDVDADEVGPAPTDGAELERLSASIGRPMPYFLSGTREAGEREPMSGTVTEALDPLTEVYRALVTGTRDYVRKSGFPGVVIGLSGGIDSALTVAIAVDALGAEHVTAFFMPSQYTADQSYEDSLKLTQNLGVRMEVLPIKAALDQYLASLGPLFEGREPDTTEENLQARIRGNLLMAASNKFGWIVLTTGNKSEMATGYATLYGDMAGGFAVIKDVPKTLVTEIARHTSVMAGREVIPESIIVRPPTAELRPDQKDEDSLPPYAVLDPIIEAYVENDWSVEEMLAADMPADAVELTMRLVDRSEYKRRQAPPGVKITRRNFGRDRRLPLVNKFRPQAQA